MRWSALFLSLSVCVPVPTGANASDQTTTTTYPPGGGFAGGITTGLDGNADGAGGTADTVTNVTPAPGAPPLRPGALTVTPLTSGGGDKVDVIHLNGNATGNVQDYMTGPSAVRPGAPPAGNRTLEEQFRSFVSDPNTQAAFSGFYNSFIAPVMTPATQLAAQTGPGNTLGNNAVLGGLQPGPGIVGGTADIHRRPDWRESIDNAMRVLDQPILPFSAIPNAETVTPLPAPISGTQVPSVGGIIGDSVAAAAAEQPVLVDSYSPARAPETRPYRPAELSVPPELVAEQLARTPKAEFPNYLAGMQDAAGGDYESAYRRAKTAVQSGGDEAHVASLSLHSAMAYKTGRYAEAHDSSGRALAGGLDSEILKSIHKLTKDNVDASKKEEEEEPETQDLSDLDVSVEGSADAYLTPQAKLKAREYSRRALHEIAVGDYKKAADSAEVLQALAPSPRAYNLGAYAKLRADSLDGALQDSGQAYTLAKTQLRTNFRDVSFRKLPPSDQAQYQALSKEMIAARRIEGAVHGKRSAWREMLSALADAADVEDRAHLKPSVKKLFMTAQNYFETQRLDLMAALAEELVSGPSDSTPARRRRAAPLSLALGSAGLAALAVLWIVHLTRKQRAFPTRMRSALLDEAAGQGAPVEKFRILRSAGRGGMGSVYVAEDLQRGRVVALKTLREELRSNAKVRERFLSEARIVAKLEHPNIVAIHDVLATEAGITLVFEFIEGETLSARLKGRPLTLEEARGILLPVAAAVEFAHAKRIIHQDLKPANIMIARSGQVKVMDFGLARQVQNALSSATRTGQAAGTPPYMSPELEEGVISPAADVFALGVTLYEVLTGEPPFTGTSAGIMLQKREGKFTPVSKRVAGMPAELDALIARALAPQADLRHESARQFAAALNALPFRTKIS